MNLHGFKAHFLSFLGFKFQSNFLGFIFKNGLDSGFKFQIGGIQDSDLGLQGPPYCYTHTWNVIPTPERPFIGSNNSDLLIATQMLDSNLVADLSLGQRKCTIPGIDQIPGINKNWNKEFVIFLDIEIKSESEPHWIEHQWFTTIFTENQSILRHTVIYVIEVPFYIIEKSFQGQ